MDIESVQIDDVIYKLSDQLQFDMNIAIDLQGMDFTNFVIEIEDITVAYYERKKCSSDCIQEYQYVQNKKENWRSILFYCPYRKLNEVIFSIKEWLNVEYILKPEEISQIYSSRLKDGEIYLDVRHGVGIKLMLTQFPPTVL